MSSSYLYHIKKCTTCTSFSADSRMQNSKSMLKNPFSVEMNSNISVIGSPERESNRYLRKWRRSTTLLRQRIHENYTDSSVSSTTIVTHTISLSHMALLQDGTTCPYCELKIFIRQYKKKWAKHQTKKLLRRIFTDATNTGKLIPCLIINKITKMTWKNTVFPKRKNVNMDFVQSLLWRR
jgi:DNA-directed RNA polymerase subunit RPC12/RpoP